LCGLTFRVSPWPSSLIVRLPISVNMNARHISSVKIVAIQPNALTFLSFWRFSPFVEQPVPSCAHPRCIERPIVCIFDWLLCVLPFPVKSALPPSTDIRDSRSRACTSSVRNYTIQPNALTFLLLRRCCPFV
jgi:hypothetical protein